MLIFASKSCENIWKTEKANFDQHSEFAATKCWLKYTAPKIKRKPLNAFYIWMNPQVANLPKSFLCKEKCKKMSIWFLLNFLKSGGKTISFHWFSLAKITIIIQGIQKGNIEREREREIERESSLRGRSHIGQFYSKSWNNAKCYEW